MGDQIGNLEGMKVMLTKDMNEKLKWKYYTFDWNDVLISFLDNNMNERIILDSFYNKHRGNKKGKILFCYVLKWIEKNLDKVDIVELASVPKDSLPQDISNNQRKLNEYYQTLGFIPTGDDNDFESKLSKLLDECDHVEGGIKRTKRKKTKEKNKKQKLKTKNKRKNKRKNKTKNKTKNKRKNKRKRKRTRTKKK
jgi:hypothetical protein